MRPALCASPILFSHLFLCMRPALCTHLIVRGFHVPRLCVNCVQALRHARLCLTHSTCAPGHATQIEVPRLCVISTQALRHARLCLTHSTCAPGHATQIEVPRLCVISAQALRHARLGDARLRCVHSSHVLQGMSRIARCLRVYGRMLLVVSAGACSHAWHAGHETAVVQRQSGTVCDSQGWWQSHIRPLCACVGYCMLDVHAQRREHFAAKAAAACARLLPIVHSNSCMHFPCPVQCWTTTARCVCPMASASSSTQGPCACCLRSTIWPWHPLPQSAAAAW